MRRTVTQAGMSVTSRSLSVAVSINVSLVQSPMEMGTTTGDSAH